MKIGIDARPLSYRLTGIGFYLKYLLDALQVIDQDNYYYLISNGPISYDLFNPKWVKIQGRCKKKLISTLWMQAYVPNVASNLKLNLFWGPRHNLPLFLPLKVKTVLTIHDIVHILYPETMSLPNLIVERLLMRWSVKRSTYIICDSISTSSGLKKAYRIDDGKVQTIYPGAPDLIKRPKQIQSKKVNLPSKYFLFVGTLEPRKNFERIFRAFERTRPEKENVHLVVVGGTGWKNKDFLISLKRNPLSEYVHMMGYLDTDQLISCYENALCLLFPSLYEGFGFPVLEAMANRTPVITSNISSMPEVGGDAALLVDPYDIEAISNAMKLMLGDEMLRNDLITKGLKRVKKFTWEQCATETLNVFEKAVSG